MFLPMSDWHTRIQRTQHLATGLAELGHRCFYLNPHLGREFPSVYAMSRKEAIRCIDHGVMELHVHLWREPVFHHRRLLKQEEDRVVERLEYMLSKFKANKPVLIVSFPVWAGVASRLKRRLGCSLIYDCHDLLEGFENVAPELKEDERELVALSDRVVFTADWLQMRKEEQYPELKGRWTIVRNAANPQHFAQVRPNPHMGKKTIGYVGSLAPWFDVEAVELAATQRQDWQFLLIGRPETDAVSRLQRLPNVRFLGEIPYCALPNWLSKMDAAMIPFKLLPITMATNPIKMYEYLAAGLPIVSSALPEVNRLRGVIECYRTPVEFVDKLAKVLERDDLRRIELQHSVRFDTWTSRCEELQRCFASNERLVPIAGN